MKSELRVCGWSFYELVLDFLFVVLVESNWVPRIALQICEF